LLILCPYHNVSDTFEITTKSEQQANVFGLGTHKSQSMQQV